MRTPVCEVCRALLLRGEGGGEVEEKKPQNNIAQFLADSIQHVCVDCTLMNNYIILDKISNLFFLLNDDFFFFFLSPESKHSFRLF